MLILSRKLGETIRIGNDVTVTITEIRSGQVKVGIEANKDVVILREELYSNNQDDNTGNRKHPTEETVY